jgi:hypothetical protein
MQEKKVPILTQSLCLDIGADRLIFCLLAGTIRLYYTITVVIGIRGG